MLRLYTNEDMTTLFEKRLQQLQEEQRQLISRRNEIAGVGNGVFDRYKYPVLTAAHTPIYWRYDLDEQTNPYLAERFGINATFNAGAIKLNGKYLSPLRLVWQIDKEQLIKPPLANPLQSFADAHQRIGSMRMPRRTSLTNAWIRRLRAASSLTARVLK